ncbi:sigma-54 interaction domain-containing protein [Noviherbaspirillum saxi]|uniref:AAA family ATPase n=1 Tax=Noviherbaspirillum saxi TaxID=2320863 RepID=A0A3A3FFD5_9BURK|nr:sigma 54-interacting transcriptional regulator [Noviherbaspirillum saxi]RJF91757.1 AAA family ATPase [Noviherbaspirillum saxi]
MNTNRNDPLAFGVLVLDTKGEVICATDLARDDAVQKRILERYRNEDRRRGMLALEGEPKLIATFRAGDDATMFFIQNAASKSTLFDFVANVDFAHAVFDYFLNNPYESVVVVDDQARVRYIPPVHERFFGIEHGEAIGKKVTDVIENTNLHEVVRTGKAEIGKLQEMGGVTRVVARIPLIENGKTLGALGRVMFKGPETVVELSKEVVKLRSEVEFYRKELSGLKRRTFGLDNMVGNSDAIRQLKADIAKVAPLSVPVLIIGESGTGKELAAHAIHALSKRSENPMVFVNAAALPASLVESELFGYEGGAFTGAERKGRKGKFELADQSSLFFDEIGDMPAEVQVKLLRVLQDDIFERVGGDRPRHSDFRLISATNRNFQEMIAHGEFRLDLYYRISGVTIRMPSLRERPEDIPELVQSFLVAFAERHRTPVKGVDSRVYSYLKELSWPGNVRQLLHEVEKAAIFCDGPEIALDNFRLMPQELGERPIPASPVEAGARASASGKIQDAIEEMEKSMIRDAMVKYKGNKKKVAEELGISRAYLYKKLSEEGPALT